MPFKISRFLKVFSIALTIALTIALLSPTISYSNPTKPATLSSDSSIDDRPPSTDPYLPTNLRTERTLPPNSGERSVICTPGETDCDSRVPMRSRSYPWSAIGLLKTAEGQCTATLTHENWILTNAHCVVDQETHEVNKKTLTFFPNLINGSATDSARVIYIVYGTDFRDSSRYPNAHPQDWAMLKIDKPLGKTYGTIGLKALPLNLVKKNPKKFVLAGYSGDFPNAQKYPNLTAGPGLTAGVHEGCSIIGETDDKFLIHNCDTRPGASGSAMMTWIQGKPYIVAVHSSGFKEINGATNIDRVIEWITRSK
jgi:protease YdgD